MLGPSFGPIVGTALAGILCVCAGMSFTFQDYFGKRKNFLDTLAGKFFAGGVARS
jgi:hypothetical protein